MKKTKLFFLSLFVLLLFQNYSHAQLNGIDGISKVCYGDVIPYSFDGNITSVTGVTINPASAGEVIPFTTSKTSTTIRWNSNLTTATITVNYIYDQTVWTTNGCTNSNGQPYDCNVTQPTSGTITSGVIGLKAPTGNISGPPSITCTDPSPVTYTVSGADVTNWNFIPTTVGVGSWTLSSSNTNSATFAPNIGVSGKVVATIKNPACNNSTATISQTVDRPPLKPLLTGPSAALSQSAVKGVPVTYTIGTIPGATSYTFSATAVGAVQPAYYEIASRPVTSPTAVITFQYSAAYILTIGYTGGDVRCGNGTTKEYLINVTCPEPSNVAACGTTQLVSMPYNVDGYNSDQFPRFVQDINNDGKADLLTFTATGAFSSINNGSGVFPPLAMNSTYWAVTSSWPNQNTTPRFLADVDGLGGPDIIGFASNAIYVSKNNGNGSFYPPTVWSLQGCSNTGWTNQDVTFRNLVDINQDGRADVVGFGSGNTFVMYAKPDGTGFRAPVVLANCSGLSNTNYPSNFTTPRQFADVNNDGALDIVFFRNDGVCVAVNKKNQSWTGDNFYAPALWMADFGTNSGYTNMSIYPRAVRNMNNDAYPDIVAFGYSFVFVSLGTGSGFAAPTKWSEGYTPYVSTANANSNYTNMDVNPRLLGDVTGDGLPDLIGFKQTFVAISKNTGSGFACPDYEYTGINGAGGAYTGAVGYTSQTYFPRYLANIDGDNNRLELVGFYRDKIEATMCNSTSNFRQSVDELETIEASNVLTCYPNPASDVINFKIANMSGSASIVIYDGTGSKIKEITNEDLASGSYTLNTSSLLNGVYYYQYTDGSGNVKADKFIIMK